VGIGPVKTPTAPVSVSLPKLGKVEFVAGLLFMFVKENDLQALEACYAQEQVDLSFV